MIETHIQFIEFINEFRRDANIPKLRYWHPDIHDFVYLNDDEIPNLKQYNLSFSNTSFNVNVLDELDIYGNNKVKFIHCVNLSQYNSENHSKSWFRQSLIEAMPYKPKWLLKLGEISNCNSSIDIDLLIYVFRDRSQELPILKIRKLLFNLFEKNNIEIYKGELWIKSERHYIQINKYSDIELFSWDYEVGIWRYKETYSFTEFHNLITNSIATN